MKPLTQDETTQLLVLLRKLWKDQPESTIARIAKNLFRQIVEEGLYQQETPASE